LNEFKPKNERASDEIVLFEVIDESLQELFGTRPREALYDHLERNYGITRESLPKHLDELSSVLRKHFGRSGITVERRVARKFLTRMGKEYRELGDLSLSAYIKLATKTLNEQAVIAPGGLVSDSSRPVRNLGMCA
jgi:hypothetical protein